MKNNKFITFFVLVSILFFTASYARADSYHGIIIEQLPVETTIINNQTANGAALAIAMGQINFDWSTQKNQASIGAGSFDNQDAISFGFGKRFGDILINGSIGRESNKTGYGVGLGFRF